MEKTFSAFLFAGKKFFYYSLAVVFSIISIVISGCGSSAPEDPAVIRARDSLSIYSHISDAYKDYRKALEFNQDEKYEKAKVAFEDALKTLKKVNTRLLEDTNNVHWNEDYINLAKSVTQDYLYTQTDIPGNSLAFKFANKYKIKYEEVKLQYDSNEDLEPLPDGSDVPLIRNSVVDEYIEFFSKTDRGKNFIDKTMYRSGKYFPIMRKILRYHKTPEEMIYLSVQESGLNPTIVSKAGAVGLWQFMPATGQSYGLFQDSYRDDRRDFEKSTDAAARHLKDLYRSFGDWYLAWAAYNAGPGRINSAINKSGSKDFWSLRSYLPGETKNYVPSILALSFIYRNPSDFGFKDLEYAKPLAFDRVYIRGELSLQKVAEFCDTDIETIRELNTELTQDIIPNYEVAYHLRIPSNSYKTFLKNYKKSEEYSKNGSLDPEFAGNENSSYNTKSISVKSYSLPDYDPGDQKNTGLTSNKKYLEYIYRGNEKLKQVADSFGVRVSDIRMWNSLAWGVNPKKNQIIGIYLTEKQYNKFFGIKETKEDVQKNDPDDNVGENTVIRNDYGKKNNGNNDEVKSEDKKVKKEKGNETDLKNTGEKNESGEKKEFSGKNNGNKENNTVKEKNKDKKKPEGKKQIYVVKEGDYLGNIAEGFGVTVSDLKDWNDLDNDKIITGQKLIVYSDKKITEKKSDKNATFHVVSEGENLSGIANQYGISVSELREWNELRSDIIYVGQKLKIVEPKKEKAKDKNKKTATHIVKEGENLTLIAEKYGLTVAQLKDINDLQNDVITPGQVLLVQKASGKEKNKKTDNSENNSNSLKKTHKVKKGETLASIADKYNINIKNLIKWNNLDADGTIYSGQILKLYGTDDKKTVKKNSENKKKRKRKSDNQ